MMLIIGYGNALLGDDGFGLAVVDRLGECVYDSQNIEIIACRQLLPELAEKIASADGVIFVDANMRLPAASFDFSPLRSDETDSSQSGGANAHALSAASLMNAAAAIYGRQTPAWLCSAGPSELSLGAPMSYAVAELVPVAVEAILQNVKLTELTRTGG